LSISEVTSSARKHGIAVEDMLHAVEHALRVVDQDDEMVLYIGGDTTGRLLEVVVMNTEAGGRIVHAMELRQRFYDYLR
jgi:hypothetical protein